MTLPIRLDLQQHSLEVITLVRPTLETIRKHNRDLADQLERALVSVTLNIAEAFGNARGNRRVRLETALGSLYEVEAALGAAAALGRGNATAEAMRKIDTLQKRLCGLARR